MNQPPDFNRLARLYRWMEFCTFGPWLSLTRGTFLAQLPQARHALVLGDGDGRFTARLLRANPHVQIDAVDASSAMLDALLGRAGTDAGRVRVRLADVRDWQPSIPLRLQQGEAAHYDLIATHFFLDCLTQPEVQSLARRVRLIAAPSAVWIVSEFAVPPGWFGRLVARPLVRALYLSFGWLTGLKVRTLPDHAAALQLAGFSLHKKRTRLAGLLTAELWSKGASNATHAPIQATR